LAVDLSENNDILEQKLCLLVASRLKPNEQLELHEFYLKCRIQLA